MVGGNPSVGGGGFAASPAGTAPLYYKSAEIASGSAKNLCKKSEDVGGVCPARHWFALPLWKTQWGACPDVAGAAGVSDTRRGACPVGRLPTLPLACCLAPYPPTPLPRWGRGRPKVYFAGGFAPGIPCIKSFAALTEPAKQVPGGGLAFFAARLPCLYLAFLPPIPPAPFPDGEGGAPKFISPGASPPAPLHLTACGTYRACQAGARRGACPVGRLPTLPLPSFLPPIPPAPFPGGEGGDYKFISPGASPPAPLHLTACGTYRTRQAGTRSGALPLARRGCGGVPIPCEGAPSASPVRRKTDRTAILLAVPAAKERGDRGRGTSAFEMVLSPGAGEASAARVQPPAEHHSGGDSRLRQELCEIRPAIITDSEIPLAIITEMW